MVGIKDFEMPDNCYDCCLHNYHECDLTVESIEEDYCWNGDSREKHCPLIEVEAIPKDEYENRLKADMVAMLEELKTEIEEKATEICDDGWWLTYNDIIQQKIEQLKGENKK